LSFGVWSQNFQRHVNEVAEKAPVNGQNNAVLVVVMVESGLD
jgi:hypothetical protein